MKNGNNTWSCNEVWLENCGEDCDTAGHQNKEQLAIHCNLGQEHHSKYDLMGKPFTMYWGKCEHCDTTDWGKRKIIYISPGKTNNMIFYERNQNKYLTGKQVTQWGKQKHLYMSLGKQEQFDISREDEKKFTNMACSWGNKNILWHSAWKTTLVYGILRGKHKFLAGKTYK